MRYAATMVALLAVGCGKESGEKGQAGKILLGLGAGALPGHLFHKLLGEGHRLHRFEGCGRPLKNVISVASLRDRSQSPAASAAQSWITDSLLKSKP